MIAIKDECVGCSDSGMPCMGILCPNRHVIRYYCDKCKCGTDELYVVENRQLCSDCVMEKFQSICCDSCGDDADELYNVDGSNLCWKCLLKTFPTVAE